MARLRAALLLLGSAVLLFFGGLIFAVGRWNAAETDRAFVEAGARAARLPAESRQPLRFWAPNSSARPGPAHTALVQATERQRSLPAAPPQRETAPKPPAAGP